ncbi:MAG: shikimate dehydrogenase [Chloroflexi bacterium]|nr:shikimate dehydrogenase [Chloroflexota bacterium]
MKQSAAPTMLFVGVTTGQSASMRMFPRWAQLLGLGDAQLEGVDLPLFTLPADYRAVVERVKSEPHVRGALITSHKLGMLRAGRGLIDELTTEATLSGEASCLYKRDGRLIGHATDIAASGQAMAQFVPVGHWRRGEPELLCFGAGGAAVALALNIVTVVPPDDRPNRVTIVDPRSERLESLYTIVSDLSPIGVEFTFIENGDPRRADLLVSDLAHGSLVINATGMGKDLPGSPITDAAEFPERGIAWDLNYRGDLDFLQQARAQQADRALTVTDGWDYFVLGWAEVVSRVFDVPITPDTRVKLAESAAAVR